MGNAVPVRYSSCPAADVVKNGRTILSNIISSQIDLHKLYGGVVPEIASRKHIEKINQVIEEALKEANVTLMIIVPLIILYLFAQRAFVESISNSGIKM